MFRRLLRLEVKNFFRSPRLAAGIAMKIASIFLFIYFTTILLGLGFLLYYGSLEEHENPILMFCRYFLLYWAADLILKYIWQQLPTNNIKPLLTQNINKNILTSYTLVKIMLSFFSWAFLLIFVPFFSLILFSGNYPTAKVFSLLLACAAFVIINSFINIIINKKEVLSYGLFVILIALGVLHYFKIIDVFGFSVKFTYSFYNQSFLFLIPLIILILLGIIVFKFIKNNLYLDKGLELKKTVGKTENIVFLNKFGSLGTFLNNDLKLIKRSKAAKGAAFSGIFFLFYGFFFMYNKTSFPPIFPGIFITGGFMIVFGQRVPAWDSSYYSLMMTQNVPYKNYLKAKWWLVVIATVISMILATGYAFVKDWEYYFAIFSAGLYNLGINSYVTLYAGAFNKQPIDLNSTSKGFSNNKNNFSLKNLLLLIPQFLVPIAVFIGVQKLFGLAAAVLVIALIGFLGFLLRDKVFDYIVKIYKTEKYSTLSAFKKID